MGPLSVNGVAVQAEEFVVAYLTSLFPNVGVEMEASPPLPFYLVNRVTGHDDMISDYPVVSVHSFAASRTAASDAATAVHTEMKLLTAKTSVVVAGSACGVDFLTVEDSPRHVDYDDKTVRRYVARYRFGLRLH